MGCWHFNHTFYLLIKIILSAMQTFKLNSQHDFINEANHKIAIVHTQS